MLLVYLCDTSDIKQKVPTMIPYRVIRVYLKFRHDLHPVQVKE
jgi:hypothetical protein